MSALALVVAGVLIAQAPVQQMTPETQADWLQRSARATPTTLPTGVVLAKLPDRPTVIAHGDKAKQFVADAFSAPTTQDPSIPDTRDQPWLVLIGPDDATRQAEQALPEDIAPSVKVNRYEPTTQVVRRFGLKRAYGTQALVMAPDGTVAYEGLFELKPVVDALRKLLGMEPEPEPDDGGGWFPNPFRPSPLITINWGAFWIGLLAGGAIAFVIPTVTRVAIRTVVATFKGAIQAAVSEVQRPNQ